VARDQATETIEVEAAAIKYHLLLGKNPSRDAKIR
jgi:hypothetical protein